MMGRSVFVLTLLFLLLGSERASAQSDEGSETTSETSGTDAIAETDDESVGAGGTMAPEEDEPRVSLEIDPCVGLDVAAVERLSAVELGPSSPSDSADAPIRVHVGCEVQIVVVVRAMDGQPMTRRLMLGTVAPAAQERLLSLHITEAVASARDELRAMQVEAMRSDSSPNEAESSNPTEEPIEAEVEADDYSVQTPESSSEEPAVDDGSANGVDGEAQYVVASERVRRRFAIHASGGALFSGDFIGGGATIAFQHDPGRLLGWAVDVAFHGSTTDSSLGQIGLFLFSASPRFRVGSRWSWFGLEGSIGVRFGYARLAGEPTDTSQYQGQSVGGAWGGPMIQLVLAARPIDRLLIALTVEGGYSLLGVTGQLGDDPILRAEGVWGEDPETHLGGYWAMVNLGIGVEL